MKCNRYSQSSSTIQSKILTPLIIDYAKKPGTCSPVNLVEIKWTNFEKVKQGNNMNLMDGFKLKQEKNNNINNLSHDRQVYVKK